MSKVRFPIAIALLATISSCTVGDGGDGTVDVPANVDLGDNVHVMRMGKLHPLATGTPHLTYYGGPVISNVKVYMLDWATSASAINGESTMRSFYGAVTNSAYMDWLSEYNTSSQTIGRGSFGGSYTDPSPPSGSTIDDTAIQSEIGKRLNDGTLPANDANSIYMVHFPPGITITQGGQASCSYFCAYHGTFTRNGQYVYYGVIPDQGGACAGGCGSAPSQVQNTESVASHELIEAVTDAAVGVATANASPLAWYDSANGEIGDICNAQQGSIAGYTVQKEWSNAQNACIVSTGSTTPPPPPPPTGTTTLSNGVAVTGLSGATGSNQFFQISVPSGASNLKFAISGGTGDADLYEKFGSQPTTSSYDNRPYLTGNNETVTIASPQAGTYYAMINGYAAYSGVQIVASYDTGSTPPPPPPPPPGNVLSNGVPVTNLAAATGAQLTFTMQVPSGASSLKFAMSGGTGDADLYVKFGSAPTLSSYDCRPYVTGNTETCNISTAQAGTYYVMINGYAAFSGVQLVGSYATSGGVTALQNGVAVTNLSGATASQKMFSFTVPSGKTSLTFQISGGSGDADIYVKLGSQPTLTSYDYRPYINGNNETVNATPTAGTYYVMINGYAAYSGLTLIAQYQ